MQTILDLKELQSRARIAVGDKVPVRCSLELGEKVETFCLSIGDVMKNETVHGWGSTVEACLADGVNKWKAKYGPEAQLAALDKQREELLREYPDLRAPDAGGRGL